MIRVPFVPSADAGWRPSGESIDRVSAAGLTPEPERIERIEARLVAMELGLLRHAEELKRQVGERVLRIQSRLESALRPFQGAAGKARPRDAENVVEFFREGAPGEQARALHARNAREAMAELNDTLRLTREHLEALSGSIERMRRSLPGR